MGSEHPTFGVLRPKALHDLAPEHSGCPHFCNFKVKIQDLQKEEIGLFTLEHKNTS
jgi:hypothetical protein